MPQENQQEKNPLEPLQRSAEAAGKIQGAIKTGKAIAGIAKGAATGGPYGAVLMGLWANRKSALIVVVSLLVLLLLPVLLVLMLPSVIFGGLDSSIQTTADLYSHLTFQEKLNSAETLKNFDQIEIYDLSEENRVSVSEWNARLDFEDRAKVMAFLNTGLMNDISDSEDGSYDSMILRNGQEPLLSEVTLDDDNVVEDMYCSCESGFCIHLAAMLHEIEAGHVKKCSEDEI